MNRAQKLLEAFDAAYAADHYAADKILQELQQSYKKNTNRWLQAQIQLRTIIIGEGFKRNTKEELLDSKLLSYFEKNGLLYEAAALLLCRINFLLNLGDTTLAEKFLVEMLEKNLTEVTMVTSFVYLSHWSNLHGRKHEHAQRLSVSLKALQKLGNITNHDSEWCRFFLIFSGNIIQTYTYHEEFELAVPYINPAIEIIEDKSVNLNVTEKAYFLTVVAEYYAGIKDYPSAITYFSIAKNMACENPNYSFIYLHTCNALAREYVLWYDQVPTSQQRAKLLEEIENNLSIIENHKDRTKFPVLEIVIPTNRGKFFLLKKNYAEAIKELEVAQERTDKSKTNAHTYTLGNCRLQHTAYYEWWQQTKDENKLELAYKFSQKVREIVEAEGKEKVKNRLEAVRGFYELEQKKLNEQLLKQQVEAINKELQMTNLHLHEKVMVLDDLKKYIHSLKKKEPEARQVINTIDKKIDAVKITEQEKASLQQKMNESSKHLSKILSEEYPSLSTYEIQMCTLFQTGITDKELVKLYGQTERAYRQQRYRIKKKMKLNAEENLVKHLLNLNATN